MSYHGSCTNASPKQCEQRPQSRLLRRLRCCWGQQRLPKKLDEARAFAIQQVADEMLLMPIGLSQNDYGLHGLFSCSPCPCPFSRMLRHTPGPSACNTQKLAEHTTGTTNDASLPNSGRAACRPSRSPHRSRAQRECLHRRKRLVRRACTNARENVQAVANADSPQGLQVFLWDMMQLRRDGAHGVASGQGLEESHNCLRSAHAPATLGWATICFEMLASIGRSRAGFGPRRPHPLGPICSDVGRIWPNSSDT